MSVDVAIDSSIANHGCKAALVDSSIPFAADSGNSLRCYHVLHSAHADTYPEALIWISLSVIGKAKSCTLPWMIWSFWSAGWRLLHKNERDNSRTMFENEKLRYAY